MNKVLAILCVAGMAFLALPLLAAVILERNQGPVSRLLEALAKE